MTDSPMDRTIQLFAEMPGIGKKTAQRLAYYILNRETDYAFELALAVKELKQSLRWCSRCYNISEQELCGICRLETRDPSLLCVVEDAVNIANVEKSAKYHGYYHVLQGVLSPVNGIGPEELKIKELYLRLKQGAIREVILATNPTVEGEATAMYLADTIKAANIKVTRIGVGVPIGGNLDYCDEITMAKALENRRTL